MARLSITTLGAFAIRIDDAPVELKSAKARGLLAYLAVEMERPQRREALAELLWPDRAGPDALSNLRYVLSDLRKAIGDRNAPHPHLLVQREEIRFNQASDHWLDVASLRQAVPARCPDHASLEADPEAVTRLSAALHAYTGRFLDGFSIDSAAFENWLLLRREEIERRVLNGLRCLATFHESLGRYREAEDHLRQQLALEPWNEQTHSHLLRVLALDGRRSEALAHFETARRQIRDELDAEPTPETLALVEQIRRGALARPAPPAAPASAPRPAPAAPSTRPPAAPAAAAFFVDRAPELARLDAALQRALAGHGQVLLVGGEPGSGKTALLEEFTRRACLAHPDLLTAAGHCSAQGGIGDPFLPFQEIYHTLAHLLPDTVPARFRQYFQAFTAIGRLHQEPIPVQELSDYLRAGLLDEAAGYVRLLAEHRPLLLLFHRLHWADPGSLGLFFYLAQQTRGERVLMLASFRPAAGRPNGAAPPAGNHHSLAEVIGELRLLYGDVALDLSQADGRAFVDALVDAEPNALDEPWREALLRWSGGNALCAVDLLHSLREQGRLARDDQGRWVADAPPRFDALPPRVETLLAAQVDRLAGQERELLQVASVAGEAFAAETLAQALGLEQAAVVRLLSDALARRQRLVEPLGLQPAGGQLQARYRFRQLALRHTLYRGLDEAERALYHRLVAEALEQQARRDAGALVHLAPELVRHFDAARLPERALPYLP